MTDTGDDADRPPLGLEMEDLRERLASHHDPRAGSQDARRGWQAATALVIAPHEPAPAIAFIRRTDRPGDRWSGDMALPGGTRDDVDPDLAATAVRETREEVGLELGEAITRLPDQRGRVTRGLVATFVHVLDERPRLEPDPHEVAEALWIPLDRLLDPTAVSRTRWNGLPFPALEHEGRVIWGLTHRIIGSFLEVVGLELPPRTAP
jgi:8-oxo-dGTP pyrophosphatase MutT (NUDIX family)